jgi:hypothetical protein
MNGTGLHVGDTVNIPCVVKELHDGCDLVSLETIQGVGPRNQPEPISAISPAVVVLSRRPANVP